MSEADKRALRRIPLEVLNEGKLEGIDEVIAESYVDHALPLGYQMDREGLRAFIKDYRSAFPDLEFTVRREIAEDDTVVQFVSASGTMQGDFLGMKATGLRATWDEMHVVRMRDGKAVEHWGVVDQLRMLQQLGLAPAPPDARAA